MASISKRASGAWQNTSYGIRATATDTITTLPTTIYGDGTNATISVKGNTTQNGTPTPDNPIMPEGCGDLETAGAKAGQYKIPISSAGQTTPVYLGEVQSTRQIKKLVLTENKTIGEYDSTYNRFSITIPDSLIIAVRLSPVICSHYQAITDGRTIENVPNNAIYSDSSSGRWFIKTTEYTTATDFKTYLQQQYSAGTPVCVWYVLETPETTVVNEPLMKIDDYADEVNGISIPTTDGATTLSVGTTVQPSGVSVNYHGWHMGAVHERANGEWD